jgi:hypothetical protein
LCIIGQNSPSAVFVSTEQYGGNVAADAANGILAMSKNKRGERYFIM